MENGGGDGGEHGHPFGGIGAPVGRTEEDLLFQCQRERNGYQGKGTYDSLGGLRNVLVALGFAGTAFTSFFVG